MNLAIFFQKAKEMGFEAADHADEVNQWWCWCGGWLESGAERDRWLRMTLRCCISNQSLPATTFSLLEDTYAPARKMLDAGIAIT